MIAPASLIGFALVLILCTWGFSALGALAVARATAALRRRGPRAERRAAGLALLVPPILGAAVAFSLAVYSATESWVAASDHCGTHGHHLHLCLQHGGDWATNVWAVALSTGVGAVVLLRLLQRAGSMWRARKRLAAVASASRVVAVVDGIPVLRAPSRRLFCFVGGLRAPRIYVAAAAWDRLDGVQRRAMIAHELAHVRQGDLWRSSALSALTLLGAPFCAGRLLHRWQAATERLCDRVAAERTDDAESVASALLSLSAAGPRVAFGPAFVATADQVVDRVIAVLDEIEDTDAGSAAASRLTGLVASAAVCALAITGLCAEQVHHALETVLGAL